MVVLYYLVMFLAIGVVGLVVYDKIIHPALFKEELEETLEDAAEEKTRRKVKEEAKKLLDK